MTQVFQNPGDALPGTNEMDMVAFARICKALGHPARVRIVEHLRSMDRCICGEIVDILPLAQSTVSQHLKCLKNAGLIQGNVEGPRTCYCLNKDMLKRFRRIADKLSL
jgi:ArsR family transcriptional regulator, arsenate/arsenite/antimonite-responsive transcriptional repressor